MSCFRAWVSAPIRRFPHRLLCAGLLLGALPAQALRFYVNSSPTVGDDRRSVQSAQNPATPFRTIAHALRIAHLVPEGRPHVIQIAPGTYSPSATGEVFPLVFSQAGIYLETTGTTTFDAEGRSNFFRITAPTRDLVVRGIIFLNGRAEQGGAIYCETCSLRVVNNTFFYNRATQSGHVLFSRGGRLKFFNNLLRENGSAGDTGAVLTLHHTFADTAQRDQIRNNTFYLNPAPDIQTSGNRVDISDNIFASAPQPAILDASPDAFPLVHYNLFWETPILYLSDRSDSIKVARTVRDTVTLAERGVLVPSFFLNQPDTVAKAGSLYRFVPEVKGNKAAYIFTPLTLPAGISATEVSEQKQISWTPALADTGRRELRIEIQDPVGTTEFLHYNIRVYSPENFPDTTYKGPTVIVTQVPDTTGALRNLNALIPVFSRAASAGNNLYANPRFVNTTFNRFELDFGSPAIDAGNPIVALRDSPGNRNDLGAFGGPGNAGAPAADTSFAELNITSLPDSLAVEGQVYTYAPLIERNPKVFLIDLLAGLPAPPTLSRAFGREPPIQWTPTLADTGSYLVGVMVYTNDRQGRHYFPLRVKPANDAPLVTSTPPALAFEDSLFSYAIAAADPNGDPLSFSVVSGPAGLAVDSAGTVRWTPTQAQVGSAAVEIRIDDDQGASALHRFTLEVRNTNDPPSITSQPDTLASEDAVYAYDLAAADPDSGDTLAFRLVQGPAGMTLAAPGGLRWTPTQAQVGRQSVRVQVTDASGASATQNFSLVVRAVDDPPRITSQPDTTAVEDVLYRYAAAATDEEGGVLTYALSAAPAGMSITPAGVVEWTPAQADVGRHAVTIRAADPSGLSAVQSFAVAVTAVDDPPVIAAHSPPSAGGPLVVAPLQLLQLSITATDEEGDSLEFAWRVNRVAQAGAIGPSFSYTPSASRLDTVEALVWDAADTTSFSWTVDGRSIPRLSLDTTRVDFGQVAIGDTARVVRVMRNPGRGSLEISQLQIGDLAFAALFASSAVPPGDSARVELRFIPTSLGARQSAIRFATTDPDQPAVQILVAGSGVEAPPLIGDFDGSGVVDLGDFFLFADHFGSADRAYDLNGSGVVDFGDFFLFADHFGEKAAVSRTAEWSHRQTRPSK